MTGVRGSPLVRFAAFALLGIVVPAVILAVLGYHSLRQWRRSADALFREQSRSMAVMVAEKVDMALRHAEYGVMGRLEAATRSGVVSPEAMEALLSDTPLIARLALFDRRGRRVYPPASDPGLALAGPLADLAPVLWAQGGKAHRVVGDELVVGCLVGGGGRPAFLAVLVLDPEVLRRDVLEPTLGGPEAPLLTVTDHRDRPVYRGAGAARAEVVAAVPLSEALPAWRLALYQPAGLSPQAAVDRQVVLFTGAFGLLLVVIAAGLAATYRLVRRETETARLKAEFVANVSHDLKTPLSLIRVFGETLEMGRVTDEATRREYYRVITHESERLSRLIDNVLDFSRIEGGRRTYDLVPASVEPLVRDTIESFAYVLAQQGFKVDVAVQPGLPEVPMDAEAVSQALGNLIDNAVKYSETRRVLTVEAVLRDGGLALTVGDEGIGIASEEQGRIFDKFYRVGRSETQGRRGSGVGLALVRHVAEAHRGRVSVDSRLGEGSRFTLWLPLRPTPD
ncbi:MAG TPA: HAMP domain-containing sensor histidine kinase [Methylomirabilota bacterium]|jgi:signal transduction histidine kinase|nr:HAMP domain-containing sensor histidine kinase [Methylomirabilota bacterium]